MTSNDEDDEEHMWKVMEFLLGTEFATQLRKGMERVFELDPKLKEETEASRQMLIKESKRLKLDEDREWETLHRAIERKPDG